MDAPNKKSDGEDNDLLISKKTLAMKDLLFINPPLTKEQKIHKKNILSAKKSEKRRPVEAPPPEEDDAEGTPKVKVGPDGTLVLDESSTIIKKKNPLKSQEAILEDAQDLSQTNYGSFKKRPIAQSKWSAEETKRFYQALSVVGTDFSLMESLLFQGSRSRSELHKKFKREERDSKSAIDMALSNQICIDSQELDVLKESFFEK